MGNISPMYNNSMCSGGNLYPGQSLTSPNGEFTVTLSATNGIVIWTDNNNGVVIPISSNPPANPTGYVCTITASGFLEILNGDGKIVWWVGMAERGGACLYVQNNGDVQLIATELGAQVITWQWDPPPSALVLIAALQEARTGVLQAPVELKLDEVRGLRRESSIEMLRGREEDNKKALG